MRKVTLLIFLTTLIGFASCSDDSDGEATPVLFTGAAKDYLNETENYTVDFAVSGKKEVFENSELKSREQFANSYSVRFGVPVLFQGKEMSGAGYFESAEEFLPADGYAYWENNEYLIVSKNGKTVYFAMPKDISVGAQWSIKSSQEKFTYEYSTIARYWNSHAKLSSHYEQYTASNGKKYSGVIQIDVTGLDSLHSNDYYPGTGSQHMFKSKSFNGSFFFAKGLGPIEVKCGDCRDRIEYRDTNETIFHLIKETAFSGAIYRK